MVLLIVFNYMYSWRGWGCCATAHVRFPDVGSRNQTRVLSLGSRGPFPLSYLTGLTIGIFSCCLQIHKASATIIEPAGESDNPLRFTSGLVVALDVDATLEHVQDPQNTVKVQVCEAGLP